MPFEKGNSGNIKGRPPGKPNKTNQEIREAFQQLIECNLSNIETWLKEVAEKDPAKALDFMLKLSEYIIPRLKSIEMSTDPDGISSEDLDLLLKMLSDAK